MEKYKRNKLFPTFSSQSTNKFKSIMNSPNFGNQQILLQSCCFFDSERSQTPHASHTLIKEFKVGNKNKYGGSPKVSYSNGNIGSFKKFHFLCYLMMIIDHIQMASLISMIYPLSIFCYAIFTTYSSLMKFITNFIST